MNRIILLGGGGHAKVLIDLIKTAGHYEIAGILDKQLKIGSEVAGIPVLGNDDFLPELYSKGIKNACIAVGSIKDNSKRRELFERVKQIGFNIPYLVHPSAIVSGNSRISEGVQIMPGAIIQTDSLIGRNTIINTGVIIEHDCKIGKHIHVCPGAVVSGGSIIGDNAFIGAGATVINGIKIGSDAVIAAGAVVINNVPDGAKVIGIPAK